VLMVLGVSGCGGAGTRARFIASSTPVPTRPPAGAAGGACYLLEYEAVEQIVGTSFDVAAAGATGDTFTCVLQTNSGSYPDLTLAVTAVNVDAAAFMSTVSPKRSAAVTALGKAGYSAVLSPGAGAGQGVEIGWLSGNNQLLVLRYRCAPAATSGDVDAVTPKLVELAKKIDKNSV
ncbi:MAG: hypothetical protein JWP76_33, partial [Dactylosporangium sp.]|nr:hypothetical protein [Dactylosporangium sp.]